MSNFKRGIRNPDFISALNNLLSNSQSFWHKIVNDKSLFIAIRDEYINVYHKGNSICKLWFEKGKVIGETHYKYLLDPYLNQYVKSTDGVFLLSNPECKFITSLNSLKHIKEASSAYAGIEKTGVHSFIVKGQDILDIEIAFINDVNSTDRIDFLKLEKNNKTQMLDLVFYEVKHFSNSEIRANKTQSPKVLDQLARYEIALNTHKADILISYKLVCENMKDLNLIKGNALIESVALGIESLEIDFKPRLIIFGFDQDQKDGKVWKNHRERLEKVLLNRLKTKGIL
jgi:hypothetical protein